VSEQFGEDNVNTYFLLTSAWCKVCVMSCRTKFQFSISGRSRILPDFHPEVWQEMVPRLDLEKISALNNHQFSADEVK